MQAVMITMGGREKSAADSVAELALAGVKTEVFVQPDDWEVGPASNHRNSVRALRWALEQSGPGVIFAEDDIIVKPDRFKRAYDAAVKTNEFMYFYMHDFAPRTDYYPDEDWLRAFFKARRKNLGVAKVSSVVLEGPRLMKRNSRMFGAQCFYIPRDHLRRLIDYMEGVEVYGKGIKSTPNQPIDTSVNYYRANFGLPVYCYLPHPVQHLQNRTRRVGSRRDVYSATFELVSDLDEL
jgi:hypothetical protein